MQPLVEKQFNVRAVEVFGMLLLMKVNVVVHPVEVGFFSIATVMFTSQIGSHLVQKLRFFLRVRILFHRV